MTLARRIEWSFALLLLAVAAMPGRAAGQATDTLIAPRAKGLVTAPVTVYEMGDFQCPVCKRFFTETFKTLDKEYIATGKVHWIFVNFPLSQIHPNAEAAAEFAMCASKQGKFWPTHDRLYDTQEIWAPLKDPGQYFLAQSNALGLKREAMVTCLQSGVGREIVKNDANGAARSGANATPTFYIEGGMLSGAYPIGIFRQVLDSIIKVKTKK